MTRLLTLAAGCLLATVSCHKPPPLPTGKIFHCEVLSCEWGFDHPRSLPLAELRKNVRKDKKPGHVAGIDNGTIAYVTDPLLDGVRKGDVYAAVWADFNGGVGKSVRGTAGAETVCKISIRDYLYVYKLEVVYRSLDGQAGTLEAGGQRFDVAKGRLLLVSDRGGKLRFKQLDRPGLNVAGIAEGVVPPAFTALKTHPDVVAFFSPAKKAATAKQGVVKP
jgi:hypothetical protein